MDHDARTRAGIEQHWTASERGDSDTEHAIYAADAILDYPQSGERFRGRSRIKAQRGGHPAERHFTVLRIRGGGDLWGSAGEITYDRVPAHAVRAFISNWRAPESPATGVHGAGEATPGRTAMNQARRPLGG